MIRALPDACTDGLQKTWETFKLLRGEGYDPQEVSTAFTGSSENCRRPWRRPPRMPQTPE